MKFDNTKRLQESVLSRGISLSESRRWSPYSKAIREGYKEKNNKPIADNIVATTAMLLENTYQYAARMDETTRTVNLGSFVDYGFEVIAAVVPNLIAHEIVSVQPLNAKFGTIFYLQYLYGSSKGTIAKGDVMNSPFTGTNSNTNFTGETVSGEVLGTGNGVKTEFSTTLAFTPVRTKSAQIVVNDTTPVVLAYVSTTNGVDTYAATGYSATVDLATGAVVVTATSAPDSNVSITCTYDYNMDLTDVGFSQVDLDLQSISIEATPRKIRARWLLDAAFELTKMKGIDAESELVIAMSSEIKHEIDSEMLNLIYQQAGHTGYEWDAQLPGASGIPYVEYKRTILDTLTEMSNDIFKSTKRIGANFIVGGINFCNIVETLPEFVPAGLASGQINGPHYIGTLAGKWRVFKNPFYNADVFVLGYKGASYLDAGFVYAPYMPLYATPTQVLDDFIFRKGLATSYGTVMLNNMLYAKGKITNFTADRIKPDSPIIVKPDSPIIVKPDSTIIVGPADGSIWSTEEVVIPGDDTPDEP